MSNSSPTGHGNAEVVPAAPEKPADNQELLAGDDEGVHPNKGPGESIAGTESDLGSEGDDELHTRVEHIFNRLTEDGETLSVEQLRVLLEEIGLQVTDAQLARYIEDGESRVDLESAIDIANQIHTSTLTKTASGRGDLIRIVQLTPMQYVKMKLTCAARKNVEYKILWPETSLEISPRKILLSGTLFMLLITGLAVIGTLAGMWVTTENTRERRISVTLGSSVYSFAELFESNWINIAGTEATSEVDVFSAYRARAHEVRKESGHVRRTRHAKFIAESIYKNYNWSDMFPSTSMVGNRFRTLAKLALSRNRTSYVLNARPLNTAEKTDLLTHIKDIVQSWQTAGGADPVAAAGWRNAGQWDTVLYAAGTQSLLVNSKMTEPMSPLSNVPCLYPLTAAAATATCGQIVELTKCVDLQGKAATVVRVHLTDELVGAGGITVSAFHRSDTTQSRIRAFAPPAVASSGIDDVLVNVYNRLPVHLAILDPTASAPSVPATASAAVPNSLLPPVQWLISPDTSTDSSQCYSKGQCVEIDYLASRALLFRESNFSLFLGYNNEIIGCSVFPLYQWFAVVACQLDSILLEVSRQETKVVIDYLNFNFVRSTELVMSIKEGEEVRAQVTAFRFSDDCYGGPARCQRTPASSINAIAAFETKTTGYSITPDYRPEPVIGGYVYNPAMDVALLLERDIIEIRARATEVLTRILDDYNLGATGAEVLAVRPANYPPTMTYLPTDTCPPSVTCNDVEGSGIVYRSDCVHCTRLVDPKITEISFLTTLQGARGCNRSQGCSDSVLSQYQLYHKPFSMEHGADMSNGDAVQVAVSAGYRGENMLAGYSYIANLSMGVVTEWPTSNYQDPIIEKVGLSIGIGVVFIIAALLTLSVQSRRYLDAIELDWQHYKDQITEETAKFSQIVLEVLPASVAEVIMRGKALYAETRALTIMMMNYAGFQETIGQIGHPLRLAQHASYSFLVIATVVRHFRLHKVRSIGDQVIVVGGLLEENEVDASSKTACDSVRAAACIVQLFSYLYDHFPSELEALAPLYQHGTGAQKGTDENRAISAISPGLPNKAKQDSLGDSPATAAIVAAGERKSKSAASAAVEGKHRRSAHRVEMPSVRVGINTDNCTLLVVSTGGSPNFDVVGQPVAVAHRLMTTAKRNTINISQRTKDGVHKMKTQESFVFSTERRATMKNTLITSNFVTAANIPIPKEVLKELSIKRSHPRMYFTEEGGAVTTAATAEGSTRGRDVKSNVSGKESAGRGAALSPQRGPLGAN